MTHVILFCIIQSSWSVLALLTLDILHLIDFQRTFLMHEQHNKVYKDIISNYHAIFSNLKIALLYFKYNINIIINICYIYK